MQIEKSKAMNIQIKKINGEVIFSGDFESIRQCVEAAVAAETNLVRANLYGANLDGANLDGANLYGANLVRANLDGANLDGANLVRANLYGANLDGANLVRANLYGANLDGANLDGANLDGANLDGANLDPIKNDFLAEVLRLPNELEFLRDAIVAGKINGTSYNDGECGCLAGTMARAKGITNYAGDNISNGLTFHANSNSPRERFFLAIKRGNTPETNAASKVALEWTNEAIAIRDNIRNITPKA